MKIHRGNPNIFMDFQVLDLWYQSLPRDYFLKDFVLDVDQWYNEGYVDRDVWSHLQDYLEADVLSVSFSQLTVSSGNTMVTGTSYQLTEEGKRFILRYINSAFTKG